ncbi:hypothetical protein KJ616_02165 [Patescibacteria group bacterium]|nr:hypothetical protein [Patescibacteria group bacterium]
MFSLKFKNIKLKIAIIIPAVLVAVGIIAGIILLTNSLKSVDDKSAISGQQTANATTTDDARGMETFLQGFSEASAEDLKAGDYLMIEGTDNPDGSVSANMVYIGSVENFANVPNAGQINFRLNATGTPSNANMPNAGQAPANMPNMPAGFENMTPEEKRQAIQTLRDSGSLPDISNQPGRTAGNVFLQGEFISKTEQILTIKNVDGGSKLVLYSETTKFMKKDE